jgi:nucleoside-diphosphate-sugar epimerase
MGHYLVTGGAGFIGSHIAEALVQRGDQVSVLDDLSSGDRNNLAAIAGDITFIEGDIRDTTVVSHAVAGIDFILHQAALRSVPKSMEYPAAYNDVNVTGTLNVLLAARDAGVQRVVTASSSSVYGDAERLPQQESDATRPISPYATTKLIGEYYCQLFTKAYGLGAVSMRYFNVFGPRQSLESEYAVVVPKFIMSLLQDEAPPVHGDGLQSRDFTYIDNVVQANLLACESPQAAGEVFNVACGQSYTLLDLVRELQEITGKDIPPTHEGARQGDVRHTQADVSHAKELLGYVPQVDFTEGLRRTAAWFAEHNA